jgi:Holliday junction resolvase
MKAIALRRNFGRRRALSRSVRNTKAKGSRNERRTIAVLEAAGYACMKAGASLGVFDVIGIAATDIVCCQVKSNAWPGTAELARLRAFVAPANVRKVVHRWRDGARAPDVREV